MKRFVFSTAGLLSWSLGLSVAAQDLPIAPNQSSQATSLQDYLQQRPSLQAESLKSLPSRILTQNSPNNETAPATEEPEEEIIVEEQRQPQTSAPVYEITGEEIDKQGANSVTEALRNLPGFAINDAGFAADIHTGFYYRGTTLNQNIFLLNGRSIGSNVNTYHGATDLNSILTGDIERIELSSGTASTLYGSEAFGGVVNIITKTPTAPTKVNALAQAGSYGQQNYRLGVAGALNAFGYALNYEHYQAENDYRVPRGAANRDADGRLFNADTTFNNYSGRFSYQVNPRNTVSLDAYQVSSQKGLIYFGFPLQRDRLNHDALNLGLSWKALIGNGNDSILTATVGYNKDDFKTFGPTRSVFFRRGELDSQGLTARVEHNWQVTPIYNLRYGIDLKREVFEGETFSDVPQLIRFNETEERDRTNTALFLLNTVKVAKNVQLELGLRQNFNSEFSNSTHPSAGVRWNVSPTVAVRGSWVSVRRIPGIDQLYLYDTVHGWFPNADLKPETGSAWTAGVDMTIAPRLTAQLTYFGNTLKDRIGIVAGRWENIALVKTNGLEAALRWQLTRQFSLLANYTYTDAQIGKGADKGLQLSTVPFSIAQLGVGYDSNGWQVNVYASYNSGSRRALFADAGVSTRDFSPDWLNLDLNVRIPVTKNLALQLYLENLADQSYEKVNRIYQPGLTFRLGVSANF
jgi:vitamin B12 transporter